MFKIASGLSLPVDAATQTFALLGRRGSGKTSTAVVLAEEFLKAGQPIVWVDPIGVAWGLRSKFKILIAGGEHGDISLDPGGGAAMAEFLVETRVPTILDVGTFGEGEMKRFVAAFGQRFYELNRDPVHLFFDEADEFAPQTGVNGDAAKSLGAMQRLVRRGRARGIGVTLISQRSAVLNKSVLTQTECLFAMQTTGPQDLEAVREWLKHHGTAEETAEILKELPKLQQGEAYVYSPGWLKILERVKIRARESFDSSRTPKPGEERAKPKTLAEIDLDALKGKIAESVTKAKENDPAELRKRIKALEVKIASSPGGEDEVAWKRRQSEWAQREAELIKEVDQLKSAVVVLGAALDQIGLIATGDAVANSRQVKERLSAATKLIEQGAGKIAKSKPEPSKELLRSLEHIAARPVEVKGDVGLPGQKILNALEWWKSVRVVEPTRGQVGFVAGYAVSGSFKTYLSRLATAGLIISGGGRLQITQAGEAIADKPESLATLSDYHSMLRSVVKAEPLVKILDAMIQAGGKPLSVEQICVATGYSYSGSFKTYLSRVASLDLIKRGGGLIAPTSVLFPEGLV